MCIIDELRYKYFSVQALDSHHIRRHRSFHWMKFTCLSRKTRFHTAAAADKEMFFFRDSTARTSTRSSERRNENSTWMCPDDESKKKLDLSDFSHRLNHRRLWAATESGYTQYQREGIYFGIENILITSKSIVFFFQPQIWSKWTASVRSTNNRQHFCHIELMFWVFSHRRRLRRAQSISINLTIEWNKSRFDWWTRMSQMRCAKIDIGCWVSLIGY